MWARKNTRHIVFRMQDKQFARLLKLPPPQVNLPEKSTVCIPHVSSILEISNLLNGGGGGGVHYVNTADTITAIKPTQLWAPH